ncbi:hypothetical protein ACRRTK_020135 [Alexandromys fortis]
MSTSGLIKERQEEKAKEGNVTTEDKASEETLHSSNEEEDPFRGMEPYLVRRLSSRSIQLPPLAFRQLEQADLRSESENIPRPTSLPLKILPLIAITSADSSGIQGCFALRHLVFPKKVLLNTSSFSKSERHELSINGINQGQEEIGS